MRTSALILKKQNINEYDQAITCYTEEFGKIIAVAKSILKPNSIQALHLDLFNLVDFELVSGRGMPIITGAQIESAYPNAKSNLSSLAMAYFFAETVDKLFFDYQRDDELWAFFLGLFGDLNSRPALSSEGKADLIRFFKSKQMQFSHLLGHSPDLGEYAPHSLSFFENVVR